jgi:hypothetical protein
MRITGKKSTNPVSFLVPACPGLGEFQICCAQIVNCCAQIVNLCAQIVNLCAHTGSLRAHTGSARAQIMNLCAHTGSLCAQIVDLREQIVYLRARIGKTSHKSWICAHKFPVSHSQFKKNYGQFLFGSGLGKA